MVSDRSFDIKIRLWEENDWRPALAIGIQDIAGTGIYGGEYLVASKRFWDFDISLGVGWGRLGTYADTSNPLADLWSGFADRQRNVGQGGTPRWGTYFHGESIAFFGGVEWSVPPIDTPWGVLDGLRAKVEFSGDQLRDERGGYPGNPRLSPPLRLHLHPPDPRGICRNSRRRPTATTRASCWSTCCKKAVKPATSASAAASPASPIRCASSTAPSASARAASSNSSAHASGSRGAISVFKGCGVGHLAGDGLQMPGAFLLSDSAVISRQPARTASDLPDLPRLFEGMNPAAGAGKVTV